MKLYKLAFAPFLFLAVACGGDGTTSVDIVGKTPAEQADTLADAQCDQQAACGEIDIEISQSGETITCVGTLEDVAYQACYDEARPELFATLDGCELSTADEQTIQDCYNELLAQPCVSQSQVDTYCDEVEAGNEPEFPGDFPAVCEDAFAILQACETPA